MGILGHDHDKDHSEKSHGKESWLTTTLLCLEGAELPAPLPLGRVLVPQVHRDGASMPTYYREQAVLVSQRGTAHSST